MFNKKNKGNDFKRDLMANSFQGIVYGLSKVRSYLKELSMYKALKSSVYNAKERIVVLGSEMENVLNDYPGARGDIIDMSKGFVIPFNPTNDKPLDIATHLLFQMDDLDLEFQRIEAAAKELGEYEDNQRDFEEAGYGLGILRGRTNELLRCHPAIAREAHLMKIEKGVYDRIEKANEQIEDAIKQKKDAKKHFDIQIEDANRKTETSEKIIKIGEDWLQRRYLEKAGW